MPDDVTPPDGPPPGACTPCAAPGGGGPCAGRGRETLLQGIWKNNPVSTQTLGICSALAVTVRLENALVMGGALVFVTAMSNLTVSVMRGAVPHRIRMIAEVTVIATFVIVFDQFLKAFHWEMSKQLGPYVGLIVTNCVVMGRAEAFALRNPAVVSLVDGAANGLGYAAVLAAVGLVRELLGTGKVLLVGKLLGVELDVSGWCAPNQMFVLAPGAFLVLGFLVAGLNLARGQEPFGRRP